MRSASRYGLASLVCLVLAGAVCLLCRLEGDRMVAAGQGWQMAFYLSPLVFLAVDALVLLGAAVASIGLCVGPGLSRRTQAAAAGVVCVACFVLLPWR